MSVHDLASAAATPRVVWDGDSWIENDTPAGIVLAYGCRERFYDMEGGCNVTPETDRLIPIRSLGDGRESWDGCPDCGGTDIAWAEAGRVPGSRECCECGAELSDLRYGVCPDWWTEELDSLKRAWAAATESFAPLVAISAATRDPQVLNPPARTRDTRGARDRD